MHRVAATVRVCFDSDIAHVGAGLSGVLDCYGQHTEQHIYTVFSFDELLDSLPETAADTYANCSCSRAAKKCLTVAIMKPPRHLEPSFISLLQSVKSSVVAAASEGLHLQGVDTNLERAMRAPNVAIAMPIWAAGS
jgi:hypothetical protein